MKIGLASSQIHYLFTTFLPLFIIIARYFKEYIINTATLKFDLLATERRDPILPVQQIMRIY